MWLRLDVKGNNADTIKLNSDTNKNKTWIKI